MGPRGFVTAIRTLTILPLPGRESDDLGAALPWFPWSGSFWEVSSPRAAPCG